VNEAREARLQKFFATAMERQIIYCLKELGTPKPWTEDSQFNTWYFCNVFRTQDTVTKWIIKNICEKYVDDTTLWKKVIIARRLSRIESLEAVRVGGGFEDISLAKPILQKMAALGQPIITNAFVMGIPDPSLGTNKIDYIFNLLDFYQKSCVPAVDFCISIEHAVDVLKMAPNMGGFLSYEVATDFTYCGQYLANAPDKNTWANPGPGCVRGANYVETGDPHMHVVKASNALEYMRSYYYRWKAYNDFHLKAACVEAELRFYKNSRTQVSHDDWNRIVTMLEAFNNLSMREVEHWLCEFDKHERVGKNKRTYPL
jgi:hypothetical protein